MKKKLIILLCAAIAFLSANFLTPDVAAQKADGLYIIFDASGSMMGLLSDRSRKIDAAKSAVENFLARDFRGYEIALRVYGHRRKEDCADSELLIPFGPSEKVAPALKSAINRINAVGRTPITYSLEQALKDFGDRAGEIILISDGIESCEADPCALVREWKNRNVKIRVHVVGLGLEEKERAALRCISEAAGTEYRDASSTATLAEELGRIQSKPITSVSGVKVTVKMTASGSGLWFRGNYELWQNGEKKYLVHVINGAVVAPGVYDIHLPNRLTPYVKKGVEVTDREGQHFDITVPVGHVTFVYQRADGSRDKDDRCFMSRADGNERIFKMSGERHPLTPGRYTVTGWSQKGNYERITFEIREGEDKTVALRAR